jgi:hypothetical protein
VGTIVEQGGRKTDFIVVEGIKIDLLELVVATNY